MKNSFVILSFVFILCACSQKNKVQLPVVKLADSDTIISYNVNEMQMSELFVYGINIQDSLDLSLKRKFEKTDYTKDFSRDSNKKDSLILFVDDEVNKNFHHSQINVLSLIPPPAPLPENSKKQYDSILKDYKSNFDSVYAKRIKQHYELYPLFLYNNSSVSKEIFHSALAGELDVILEAQNENGEWKPIEYRYVTKTCGTGIFNFKLHPKKYLVSAVRKYSGSFKTMLRARMLIGDAVVLSNSFAGTINKSQFNQDKVLARLKIRYSKNPAEYQTKKKLTFLEF